MPLASVVPGVTTITRTAFAPFARAPTVQLMIPLASVHSGELAAASNDVPGGSGLVTTTPVAGFGPPFVTVTVVVSGAPT